MYQPPAFRDDRIEVQHQLIREYPLGLLISTGPAGLMANSIPFLVYAEEGEKGTLRAHVARANPQWKALQQMPECLIVFQGSQDYITPSWLPTKQETHEVVPTWNYVAVHVWGKARIVEDAAWLFQQLQDLTDAQEHSRTTPWKVADAPQTFISTQMRGIVGLEIPIQRSEGKWKVSQNRGEADRNGIVAGLRAQGESSASMAELIAERGKLPPAEQA
jgi:transcriptional regulator